MKKNIRDQLLNALAVKTEEVPVDGFGLVRLRQITAGEAETLRSLKAGHEEEARKEFAYRLLVRSVFDAQDQAIFSDDDIDLLRNSSDAGLQQLTVAVLKLNGYLKDEASGSLKNDPSAASVSA